jgi:hypothetical protein
MHDLHFPVAPETSLSSSRLRLNFYEQLDYQDQNVVARIQRDSKKNAGAVAAARSLVGAGV